MKERLITGAGFWTATSLALVAALAAVIALPYMQSPTPHATRAVLDNTPAHAPMTVRSTRRAHADNVSWEHEWKAAAAAMTARTRNTPPSTRSASTTRPAAQPTDAGEEPFDPIELARAALSMVGTDPDAEQVWLAIINDPDIDPEDRKDLIEDLNEDGFADPDNLSPKDLPLIEARLALLGRLIPEPMDEANAAAFAEARKDLLDMREKLKPSVVVPTTPAQEPRPDPSR